MTALIERGKAAWRVAADAASRYDRANSEPGRASGFCDSENASKEKRPLLRTTYAQFFAFSGADWKAPTRKTVHMSFLI